MSKQRNAKSNNKSPGARSGGRRIPVSALVVVVIVALVAGWFLWRANNRSSDARPVTSLPPAGSATNPPGISVAPAGFQKLKGRWLRPDGGYIFEVKSVDDTGKMDAAYFNPRPIRVARAEASREGAVTKVLFELRDANYPGSTYTLTYDSVNDRLTGNYFQAALQQNFEVIFLRQQ